MLHSSACTAVDIVSDSVCEVWKPALFSGCSDPQSSRKSHCWATRKNTDSWRCIQLQVLRIFVCVFKCYTQGSTGKRQLFSSTQAGLNVLVQCDHCGQFWLVPNEAQYEGRITAHMASSQAKKADKQVTWLELHHCIFWQTTGDISMYV